MERRRECKINDRVEMRYLAMIVRKLRGTLKTYAYCSRHSELEYPDFCIDEYRFLNLQL